MPQGQVPLEPEPRSLRIGRTRGSAATRFEADSEVLNTAWHFDSKRLRSSGAKVLHRQGVLLWQHPGRRDRR